MKLDQLLKDYLSFFNVFSLDFKICKPFYDISLKEPVLLIEVIFVFWLWVSFNDDLFSHRQIFPRLLKLVFNIFLFFLNRFFFIPFSLFISFSFLLFDSGVVVLLCPCDDVFKLLVLRFDLFLLFGFDCSTLFCFFFWRCNFSSLSILCIKNFAHSFLHNIFNLWLLNCWG